jgi:hypothetical protein
MPETIWQRRKRDVDVKFNVFSRSVIDGNQLPAWGCYRLYPWHSLAVFGGSQLWWIEKLQCSCRESNLGRNVTLMAQDITVKLMRDSLLTSQPCRCTAVTVFDRTVFQKAVCLLNRINGIETGQLLRSWRNTNSPNFSSNIFSLVKHIASFSSSKPALLGAGHYEALTWTDTFETEGHKPSCGKIAMHKLSVIKN